MATPLDNIKDWYTFQQIVTEYFRSLKREKHDFRISDLDVTDNGVGSDGGVDLMVEFHFVDAITKHSFKWIIDCKYWDKNLSVTDLDTNNMLSLVKSHGANGYLLVCKNNVTNGLKDRFRKLTCFDEHIKYEIWEGTRLWFEISQRESLLKAFFPTYYQENFVDNKAKALFETLLKEYQDQVKDS